MVQHIRRASHVTQGYKDIEEGAIFLHNLLFATKGLAKPQARVGVYTQVLKKLWCTIMHTYAHIFFSAPMCGACVHKAFPFAI